MENKLPEGWKGVELGDEDYFTILSSGINEFKGWKDYLSTESIQGTKIEKVECVITYEDRPSRANMQPVLNSVWFAKMQATLKVYSFDEDNKDEINKYILSTGFAGLNVNEKLILPKYLKLFLKSKEFNETKDKLSTGSTQRGINNQSIKKISFIIPPPSTQKKIVSILEKIEQAKEMRKEADELTKEFLKSVFNEMFGDPRENPKKWEELTLPQIVIKDKNAMKRGPFGGSLKKIIFVKEGYLVYEQRHAIHNDFDYAQYYITKDKYNEMNIFKVIPGDLIISCSGVTLGRIAEIPKWAKPGIINQALLKISLDSKKTNNEYFKFLFRSNNVQQILFGISRGSGIPNFPSMSVIKGIKFPMPPIHLQDKFASIVKEVEQMKERQKQSKEHLDNLFNSLMQRAFKGELKNG